MSIDANLSLLTAAIAQLEHDLSWLRRLKSAVERGDALGRANILREQGFRS